MPGLLIPDPYHLMQIARIKITDKGDQSIANIGCKESLQVFYQRVYA